MSEHFRNQLPQKDRWRYHNGDFQKQLHQKEKEYFFHNILNPALLYQQDRMIVI